MEISEDKKKSQNSDLKLTPPDLEILGQKINLPNTEYKYKAFVVFIVCLTLLGMLLVYRKYGYKQTKDGLVVQMMESGNVEEDRVDLNKFVTLGFWTPSNKTEAFINDSSAEYLWQRNSWQKNIGPYKTTIDSLNIKFGEEIIMHLQGVAGYRRYEVFGHGTRHFKIGWWWAVAIDDNADENFLKQFRANYVNFWSKPASGAEWSKVYIELLGNTGKYLHNGDKSSSH